tara:strand:- start:19 stop:753 length:735 start_codon:yes stop_codon:yes gene_type:complete
LKKKINKELLSLFKKLNIKENDKIIIHSNLACINQFLLTDKNDCANFFFEFLKKYIGKKGSIIIPTYNYDFTKKKKFNHKFTKSQVGFFGNYLLKKHYKRRTRDPIFSHLVFGRNSNAFFNIKYDEAFGPNSIFSFMLKKNYKILCLGCSSNSMTFLHFLEKQNNVSYRYNKIFKLQNQSYKYFVGKKKIDYSLKEKNINKLIDQKYFIKKNYGRYSCYSTSCKFLAKKIKDKLKKNINFLISQ